jgi:hypothetical protein
VRKATTQCPPEDSSLLLAFVDVCVISTVSPFLNEARPITVEVDFNILHVSKCFKIIVRVAWMPTGKQPLAVDDVSRCGIRPEQLFGLLTRRE